MKGRFHNTKKVSRAVILAPHAIAPQPTLSHSCGRLLIFTECPWKHAFAHLSTFPSQGFQCTTMAHSSCERAQPENLGKLTSPNREGRANLNQWRTRQKRSSHPSFRKKFYGAFWTLLGISQRKEASLCCYKTSTTHSYSSFSSFLSYPSPLPWDHFSNKRPTPYPCWRLDFPRNPNQIMRLISMAHKPNLRNDLWEIRWKTSDQKFISTH